jgi:ubiquinone/menaquinone biosynthesis C-methylase UbiE
VREAIAMADYTLSAQAAEFYESTFVPALFEPWAARLAGAADLRPGCAVLDVACGTGVVARAAAEIAGRSVTGVDSNPAMLAVARRSRPDLDWRTGDAHALPFPDSRFDRVLCQAALMFFTDPVAALREMGRVGGRVVVQVPGRLSHSAGYQALADVVTRHAGTPLIGSYFAAGDPALLRQWFAAAGLRTDRFETWTSATRLASVDAFLDAELLPIADAMDAGTRHRIEADARAALAPFIGAGGSIAAPIEVHLIAAG